MIVEINFQDRRFENDETTNDNGWSNDYDVDHVPRIGDEIWSPETVLDDTGESVFTSDHAEVNCVTWFLPDYHSGLTAIVHCWLVWDEHKRNN